MSHISQQSGPKTFKQTNGTFILSVTGGNQGNKLPEASLYPSINHKTGPRDFAGPVVKTSSFHYRGCRINPWSGNENPASHSAKGKKKKNRYQFKGVARGGLLYPSPPITTLII